MWVGMLILECCDIIMTFIIMTYHFSFFNFHWTQILEIIKVKSGQYSSISLRPLIFMPKSSYTLRERKDIGVVKIERVGNDKRKIENIFHMIHAMNRRKYLMSRDWHVGLIRYGATCQPHKGHIHSYKIPLQIN